MITIQITPLICTRTLANPYALHSFRLNSPIQGNTFSCWQYNGIHEQNHPKEHVDRHLKQHPKNIMNSTIIKICKPYHTICCLYEMNCAAALSKMTIFAGGCQPHKRKKIYPEFQSANDQPW